MKNIFLIPTDQPSRIYYNGTSYKDANRTTAMDWYISSAGYKPHNIFITKEEKIEEGDWMYYKHFGEDIVTKYDTMSSQNTDVNEYKDYYKKIILTTDATLIADGVQSIDDNFLQWFVNNLSCEEVKVEPDYDEVIGDYYKIIIPKEECCKDVEGFNLGMTCPKCNKPFRIVIKEPKQTAVEKLGIAFREWQRDWDYFNETGKGKPIEYDEFIKPFLEIEKQQIIDAWCNGYDEEDRASSNAFNYYSETFKQQ
jgi:hypothetical protein